MSGLASTLISMGYLVSGSDLKLTSVTERLAERGARISGYHHPGNIPPNTGLVIVSSAIKEDNPEYIAARKKGIPVIRRAELLAWLMRGKKSIAVAGAHGKTTTSSMIALMLEKAGLDPTVVIGGEVYDIGGNAKLGRGEYLVAEADESDGSFLQLFPWAAVCTNVDSDHLDYWRSLERIRDGFKQFLDLVPDDGFKVVCADDAELAKIASRGRGFITYGLNSPADYQINSYSLSGMRSRGVVISHGRVLGDIELRVPGKHNLSNALGCIAVGRRIGLDFGGITEALSVFRGVKRRFEILGEAKGVTVVDDYGHHPAEIRATLGAARLTCPVRLVVLFQPHRYTRTKFLYPEFGRSFGIADVIVITDIYPAGEAPIPGVTAELIVEELKKNGRDDVVYLPELEEAVDYLYKHVQPGDLVLTLGAGNVWQAGEELLARLGERTAEG